MQVLLKALQRYQLSPSELRTHRVVEALEGIGTPAAQRLLRQLSKGAENAVLTQESRAALQRLNR